MRKIMLSVASVAMAAMLAVSASASVVGKKVEKAPEISSRPGVVGQRVDKTAKPAPTKKPQDIADKGGVTTNKNTGKLYAANSSLYRGTLVSTVKDKSGNTILTLKQAEGTNFGVPSMKFKISKDTKLSFKLEEAGKDAYIEVFYTTPKVKMLDPDTEYSAIAVNDYFVTDMVNFNGTVVKVMQNNGNQKGDGQLLMKNKKTGEEVLFNFNADKGYTQFYVDIKTLKPGDSLNIFHRGISTMSIPAQYSALEVRNYSAGTELSK